MKISEDQIPHIQLSEVVAPAAPAAGLKRLYAKVAGLFYKNSAGVEKQIATMDDLHTVYYDQIVALGDETTAITTGAAKVTFRAARAFSLTGIKASLSTVSSSGAPQFDVNVNGVSVLSTKVTIDATESTSATAAVPAVLTATPVAIAADDVITIDIDTAGTGAAGAKVSLLGYTS